MTQDQIDQIVHNWSSMHDVWQGDTNWVGEGQDDAYVYPPASLLPRPGYKFRELPEHYADEARRYITILCGRYPLQMRVLLGLPMWLRFCETWNDTGDRRKSMRAI